MWLVAALLVLAGLAGAVLPALPGVPLVFGGLVVAAWADDFQRVGWVVLTSLGVLTVASFAIDLAATALGAKRVGATRLAIAGAALAVCRIEVLAAWEIGYRAEIHVDSGRS